MAYKFYKTFLFAQLLNNYLALSILLTEHSCKTIEGAIIFSNKILISSDKIFWNIAKKLFKTMTNTLLKLSFVVFV